MAHTTNLSATACPTRIARLWPPWRARSTEKAAPSGPMGWLRFRLLVAWGPRLALAGGLVLAFGGLAMMVAELSTDIWRAFGGELILTAGALLIGKGIQLRWYQAHPEHALRRRRA